MHKAGAVPCRCFCRRRTSSHVLCSSSLDDAAACCRTAASAARSASSRLCRPRPANGKACGGEFESAVWMRRSLSTGEDASAPAVLGATPTAFATTSTQNEEYRDASSSSFGVLGAGAAPHRGCAVETGGGGGGGRGGGRGGGTGRGDRSASERIMSVTRSPYACSTTTNWPWKTSERAFVAANTRIGKQSCGERAKSASKAENTASEQRGSGATVEEEPSGVDGHANEKRGDVASAATSTRSSALKHGKASCVSPTSSKPSRAALSAFCQGREQGTSPCSPFGYRTHLETARRAREEACRSLCSTGRGQRPLCGKVREEL